MRGYQEASLATLTGELQEGLEARHGPIIGGDDLLRCLGYRTAAGFRQARRRGHVAVAVFALPNRRGFYALTRDVVHWLAQARLQVTGEYTPERGGNTTLATT